MRQDNDGKIGKAQVKSGITVVECERQGRLLTTRRGESDLVYSKRQQVAERRQR